MELNFAETITYRFFIKIDESGKIVFTKHVRCDSNLEKNNSQSIVIPPLYYTWLIDSKINLSQTPEGIWTMLQGGYGELPRRSLRVVFEEYCNNNGIIALGLSFEQSRFAEYILSTKEYSDYSKKMNI